jgi:hypothetical protein
MRFVRLAVLACALALIGTSLAGAFTVPPTTVVGAPGEVHLLWTEPVAADDVGKVCDVELTKENNQSVREGSDLILQSGTSTMVAENVEHETGPATFTGTLTLGTTITVSVRLGPEVEYSGGSDVVEATCAASVPPVTPTPPIEVASGTTQTVATPVLVAPAFTG